MNYVNKLLTKYKFLDIINSKSIKKLIETLQDNGFRAFRKTQSSKLMEMVHMEECKNLEKGGKSRKLFGKEEVLPDRQGL